MNEVRTSSKASWMQWPMRLLEREHEEERPQLGGAREWDPTRRQRTRGKDRWLENRGGEYYEGQFREENSQAKIPLAALANSGPPSFK
jgi:hypothetical protein